MITLSLEVIATISGHDNIAKRKSNRSKKHEQLSQIYLYDKKGWNKLEILL